jgi:hypothetical protein
MNVLNYHKLVNLKKRLELFNCEISKEFIDLTDKHIASQLEISKQKDKERRIEYQKEYNNKIVKCDVCEKEMKMKSFYKHKKSCFNTHNETSDNFN